MIEPSMAVVPILEPLKHEKSVAEPNVTRPNLPGMRPSHLSITSMAVKANFECMSTSPIIIKRGTGSREKIVTELKTLWISMSSPLVPPQKKYTPNRLITRKLKATGSPVARSVSSPPKIIRVANHQSIFTALFYAILVSV
jgi:hypothetical protein